MLRLVNAHEKAPCFYDLSGDIWVGMAINQIQFLRLGFFDDRGRVSSGRVFGWICPVDRMRDAWLYCENERLYEWELNGFSGSVHTILSTGQFYLTLGMWTLCGRVWSACVVTIASMYWRSQLHLWFGLSSFFTWNERDCQMPSGF